MATLTDYAQISGRVYQRTQNNRMYRPDGFTELQWLRDDPITGFSAGVYKKGNEIVIGFTGTNESLIKDFLVANIPAGAGLGTPQIAQAAKLVLKVMAENPGRTISFTGHSLGGGLASVMAVLFNKDASIFDPAPFEPSVRNPSTLSSLQATLALTGYSDSDLEAYFLSAGLLFSSREAKVSSWYVDGEVLVPLRTVGGSIVGDGQETKLTVGGQTAGGVSLHSITLLHALLLSPSFKEAISTKSNAVEQFFDNAFYAKDPQVSNTPDFLTKLLRQHVGDPAAGIQSNNVLDRFAEDLNRIGSSGTTANPNWQKALTAAAMDYYYNKEATNATQFFKLESGAIHFDLKDINATTLKSLPLLKTAASSTTTGGDPFASGSAIANATAWHVQTGGGSMNWQDSAAANDLAIGGASADILRGGQGDDALIGGGGDDLLDGGQGGDVLQGSDGADTLNGGAGADWLYGGAGTDTYQLTSGELFDVIQDSDGNGTLWVDGAQLTGGKKAADNYWISDDGAWGYLLTSGGDLVISKGSSAERITLRDWQSAGGNHLGITLDDTPAPATPQSGARFYTGDQRAPLDANGRYQWGQTTWAADGTLTGGVAEANFADVIYASSSDTGGTVMHGWGGNDALSGSNGRDDIFGDDGDDLIGGAAGSDTIWGGAGNDYLYSAIGLTAPLRVKPDDLWTPPGGQPVIVQGPTWAVIELTVNGLSAYGVFGADLSTMDDAPDVVDGGAGDDRIMGGRGGDRLMGGAGNDVIRGQVGDDILEGGAGDDTLQGDGLTNVPGSYDNTDPAQHGADFIDGGAGNDVAWGQGQNDLLYGGAGNDKLWGDDTEANLAGEFHGDDDLDGEAGDDRLVGGGRNDLLYGGDGDDNLWGDDTESRLAGEFHGDDDLDGEAGTDLLVGGGRNDLLYGGDADDELWGDDTEAKAERPGADLPLGTSISIAARGHPKGAAGLFGIKFWAFETKNRCCRWRIGRHGAMKKTCRTPVKPNRGTAPFSRKGAENHRA